MVRQQTLPLDGPQFEDALWIRVPEEDRRKVAEILARLLARAVQQKPEKENGNDDCNH